MPLATQIPTCDHKIVGSAPVCVYCCATQQPDQTWRMICGKCGQEVTELVGWPLWCPECDAKSKADPNGVKCYYCGHNLRACTCFG